MAQGRSILVLTYLTKQGPIQKHFASIRPASSSGNPDFPSMKLPTVAASTPRPPYHAAIESGSEKAQAKPESGQNGISEAIELPGMHQCLRVAILSSINPTEMTICVIYAREVSLKSFP